MGDDYYNLYQLEQYFNSIFSLKILYLEFKHWCLLETVTWLGAVHQNASILVNFPWKFIHGIGFWFLNGSRFSSNEALQVSDGKTTKAGSILKFGCFWTFRRKWIFLFWLRAKFEKPQMRKMLEISRVKHRNGNN